MLIRTPSVDRCSEEDLLYWLRSTMSRMKIRTSMHATSVTLSARLLSTGSRSTWGHDRYTD